MVGLRPRANVRLLAQPVNAGQRPEVHEDCVSKQLGGTEWLRVEPLSRLAERGNARTRKYGHLAKRAEPRAQLGGVQLRLLPGGEVPAAVDLVEVDEVGVRLLRPAPGDLEELVRKDTHRNRNGDVPDVGEAAVPQVLPV